MAGLTVVFATALLVTLTRMAMGQFQTFTSSDGAQVNYFQQNPRFSRTQMVVMQVQQTTTVTFIAAPITTPLAQFVINNPQGLVRASQRANRRIQELAVQAFRFKRIGLDNLRSESSCGRHTIFVGTRPISMAMQNDKNLIDLLLQEIYRDIGFSPQMQREAQREVIVYNKQGSSDPSRPVFASVTPPTPSAAGVQATATDAPLTCQDSVKLDCDPAARFRTADGTCNNLNHKLWGSSFIPMRRFLAPAYDDGVSSPRTLSRAGGELPSARHISVTIHASGPELEMTTLTHMVMQWGQFMDHDFTSAPVQTASDGSALTCCGDELPAGTKAIVDVANRTACFPIPILQSDPFFVGRTCFSFPRSVQVTNSDCQQTPVEQLNQLTSFIDASQVYGSTLEDSNNLRTFVRGQLKTSSEDLLPKDTQETCVLNNPNQDYCFKAGDVRVNEQMALSAMHTVWMRQHNRLADQLQEINPHWDDERTFQVCRKILGALLQKITYGDWLPIILDSRRIASFGLQLLGPGQQSNDYNPNVDPSIRNVFAAAVFRFGHSLIRTTMSQMAHHYQDVGRYRLQQTFGNTSQILQSQGLGVDMYMRGLLRDPPNTVDRFFTAEIQNHLFQDHTGNSLDLVAFNIQRGRDHGVPSYNAWRRFCGLSIVTSFNNMPDHDPATAQKFAQVYRHPDDVDVFSGSISERPEGNGLLGPTFACLMSRQLSYLKFGDRFWFETSNPNTGFTRDQVDQIRKHGLARVLCDVTAITQIQPNPFEQVSLDNPLTNCQDLPEMNLMLWQEGGRSLMDTASWGTWSKWSQCEDGIQTRVRSCSQGGRRGICSGSGQDSRGCNDLSWNSQWSQWSQWFDCEQGFQRRTRICQGLSNPCPGGPEEVRLCRGGRGGRGGSGSSTQNQANIDIFSNSEPPGWSEWSPWATDCTQGKQWRTRTCSTLSRGNQVGLCSGPSSESRNCASGGGNSGGFSFCNYFSMPALC